MLHIKLPIKLNVIDLHGVYKKVGFKIIKMNRLKDKKHLLSEVL